MVFWCTYPGSIPNRNTLGYSSAYPGGALAFPGDIPRMYSAGYSCCYLGMAWKNVASRIATGREVSEFFLGFDVDLPIAAKAIMSIAEFGLDFFASLVTIAPTSWRT
jgi:hypothetical protein